MSRPGVRWLEWGEAAFARSRALGRPVLLLLTATWCHACHRMDEETWNEPGVAAAVEQRTVPVRVDADARPDVYSRYHVGGLPSTVLLAPDGAFLRGGTFLSPPELFALLQRALADLDGGRRPGRRAVARARPQPASLVDVVVDRLVRRADLERGGFGEAPKLIELEALALLLARWRSTRDAVLERVVRLTLDAVAGHLVDPRDGGVFRYAAAADWSGAHTEKVALDQARVARLFLDAGSTLAEPGYVDTGCRILAHARERLADRDGRVLASVAADPEYHAGRRPASDLPAVDRRRFADSSAAMVAGAWMAHAVAGERPAFRPEFREAAPAGIVPHRLDEPDSLSGLLRDQALAIDATLVEHRLSGEPALLEWALRAADWSVRELWDEEAGAFRDAPREAASSIELPPMHPLLANGEMALALTGMAVQCGDAAYRRRAARLVAALAPEAVVSPAGPAIALAALVLENGPVEADVHGDPGDARARDLARAAVAALGPTCAVRWRGGADPGLVLCARGRCLARLDDARDVPRALVDLDLAPGGILGDRSLGERKP
ncbi:MAG TPA: DUF255 domain-containing protein [Candidatus Methylomirabilis sp.]|nr:DUF255 domain-containing protein [Candidatus Methylomirabilis sp.]